MDMLSYSDSHFAWFLLMINIIGDRHILLDDIINTYSFLIIKNKYSVHVNSILLCMSGLEKRAGKLSGISRFSCQASSFSSSLAGPGKSYANNIIINIVNKDLSWASWNSRYFQALHLHRCKNQYEHIQ